MADPIKILNGVNGQLELYQDRVTIKRKGILSKLTEGFFQGDKTIFIRQITSIKIKQAGLLTNGFIQFSLAGNIEQKRGLLTQTHDENTVFFKRKQNDLVREIKEIIEEAMGRMHGGTGLSSAEEIAKFKKLMDDGVLTPEEFENKKRQLLGG
jgi:hypothetical protein